MSSFKSAILLLLLILVSLYKQQKTVIHSEGSVMHVITDFFYILKKKPSFSDKSKTCRADPHLNFIKIIYREPDSTFPHAKLPLISYGQIPIGLFQIVLFFTVCLLFSLLCFLAALLANFLPSHVNTVATAASVFSVCGCVSLPALTL